MSNINLQKINPNMVFSWSKNAENRIFYYYGANNSYSFFTYFGVNQHDTFAYSYEGVKEWFNVTSSDLADTQLVPFAYLQEQVHIPIYASVSSGNIGSSTIYMNVSYNYIPDIYTRSSTTSQTGGFYPNSGSYISFNMSYADTSNNNAVGFKKMKYILFGSNEYSENIDNFTFTARLYSGSSNYHILGVSIDSYIKLKHDNVLDNNELSISYNDYPDSVFHLIPEYHLSGLVSNNETKTFQLTFPNTFTVDFSSTGSSNTVTLNANNNLRISYFVTTSYVTNAAEIIANEKSWSNDFVYSSSAATYTASLEIPYTYMSYIYTFVRYNSSAGQIWFGSYGVANVSSSETSFSQPESNIIEFVGAGGGSTSLIDNYYDCQEFYLPDGCVVEENTEKYCYTTGSSDTSSVVPVI